MNALDTQFTCGCYTRGEGIKIAAPTVLFALRFRQIMLSRGVPDNSATHRRQEEDHRDVLGMQSVASFQNQWQSGLLHPRQAAQLRSEAGEEARSVRVRRRS